MLVLFKIILFAHVISGTAGLLSGSMNLLMKKGGKNHVLLGKIFSIGMFTSGFSSLLLAILHPNFLLFIVGSFTIYLVGTGYRSIYLKMQSEGGKPAIVDWLLTIGMLLVAIIFFAIGVSQIIAHSYFGIVLIVFCILGLRFVRKDYEHYRGRLIAKNSWMVVHLQRMTGAYIAATSAFLVVNAKFFSAVPLPVLWLLPTLILTPVILRWTKKYTLK